MADKLSRRRFLELAGGAVALGGLYSLTFVDENAKGRLNLRAPVKSEGVDLAVVEGATTDYAAITERAVNELGGIEAFVRKGDRVVISPNMGWMRTPEQAAATHPDVLRSVVMMCKRAGASRITCIDYTLDDWRMAFDICGANAAVEGTGATLVSPTDVTMYRDVDVPAVVPAKTRDDVPYACIHAQDRIHQKVPRALIEADSYICLPIVKDHEAAVMTAAMKKLMGVIWNRKDYHRYGLHECIAEMNLALRPTLIIADATRVLQTRGPKGPGEVTVPNQVIAGIDPVAIDSYATRYLSVKGVTPDAVHHLILGDQLGVGRIDVENLRVREIAGPTAG